MDDFGTNEAVLSAKVRNHLPRSVCAFVDPTRSEDITCITAAAAAIYLNRIMPHLLSVR